jgi:PAS domain S-box-containing protein
MLQNKALTYQFDARSEAIFEHAALGILVVNRKREIEMANVFAETLFGYKKGSLPGQLLDELIPDHLRKRHEALQEQYMRQPSNRAMGTGLLLQAKRKNGQLFPVEISLSHFVEAEEHYYVAFVHDATFKHTAEQNLLKKQLEIENLNSHLEAEVVHRTEALTHTMKALQLSKADLEIALSKEKELGELKSRFVAMASHEFRTPLTTIASAADLIEKFKETTDQERREKYLSKIKASIQNLTMILEEFLSVGKLEEGKIEAHYVYFNLPELILEITSDLKNILKPGQTIIHKHTGSDMVLLDPSLIRKIMINICSNAIKFSPENTRVQISSHQGSQLNLQVADQGMGIPAEDQKHLFDRFFRAGNALNIKGTGLGLHIVAQYVALMHGQIAIKSTEGEGTTVNILF